MIKHWNERWFAMCDLVALWSEDRSTTVGAVIVDDRQNLLSVGWNGLPRKIQSIESRHQRPEKYQWFEHAERNAIYNAAACGMHLLDSTLYINATPCMDCARGIIQSGISMVLMKKKVFKGYSEEDLNKGLSMLNEAGIVTNIFKD